MLREFMTRDKHTKDKIKRLDRPIPIWTKEWDEKLQFTGWATSSTIGVLSHRVAHTGIKRTLKVIMPIRKISNNFLVLRFIYLSF